MDPLVAVDMAPLQPGFLLLVEAFLTPTECRRLVDAANSNAAGLKESPLCDQRPKKGEAFLFRDSSAFVAPELTAELWKRLRPLLPEVDRGAGKAAVPVGYVPAVSWSRARPTAATGSPHTNPTSARCCP